MTAYRNDVDALEARHAALDSERATKAREVDAAARDLAAARERAKLPVLDNIRVATPCKAAWADMLGDDRARLCGKCDKQVFDISLLTRAEAEALIIEKHGDLCARYYQRADGTILLADCTIGGAAARRNKLIAAGAAALLAGGAAWAITHRPPPPPAFDSVSVAASPESTSGPRTSGTSHDDPPPPAPLPPPAVQAEPVFHTMGVVRLHDSDL